MTVKVLKLLGQSTGKTKYLICQKISCRRDVTHFAPER